MRADVSARRSATRGALIPFALTMALGARASAQDAGDYGVIRSDPMQPTEWAESTGDDCYSREAGPDGVIAQDHICDGPRRVPVSVGAAAERAARLGLGTRPAVDRLRIATPLDAWLAEIHAAAPEDLLWPVARGLYSRGFGFVRREAIRHRPHNGVDIVAEPGAHIRAANDGLVVYADNTVRGYGNLLAILHADGSSTLYAHCRAIFVAPGQLVARGQLVAEVGRTGRPEVEHLHFEWRRAGVPQDPMPHFVERPSARAIRPDGTPESTVPPPANSLLESDAVLSGRAEEAQGRRPEDEAEGGADPDDEGAVRRDHARGAEERGAREADRDEIEARRGDVRGRPPER
ncbi:MAG: peptidoglycan DD-metalloendopeptidase family protein [Sandaracinaceae bacterium]